MMVYQWIIKRDWFIDPLYQQACYDSWTFTADKPVGKYKPAKHTYLVKAYLQNVPQSVIEMVNRCPFFHQLQMQSGIQAGL